MKTHIFINGHLCVCNQSLYIKSEIFKYTQTEYHQCIIITLNRELQVHETQPMYLLSHHKNHNNHIEHYSSSLTVVPHKYSQLNSSEEEFSDWLKISGISRKPQKLISQK